jgi:mannose-6-phosphate isomerase
MIKTPDFLTFKPIFKERIWGGRELEKLGFKIPEGNIGECWGISAHPHGMSIVDQGPYKGMSLEEIYQQYPQWFNDEKKERFPLFIKILDGREDLSVQVHPNDEYALKHENDHGKHEAWYVLKAEPNTRIQIGHHVTKKEALVKSINESQWFTLLHYFPSISKGDVIDIPPGTLHALCAGSLIFEVQQTSDVTYRVFDYNRMDKQGNKRDLHLSKALDVINVPDNTHTIKKTPFDKSNQLVTLVENSKFKLSILKKNNYPFIIQKNNYLCGFILFGSMTINGKTILPNQFFIIPSKIEPRYIEGEFEGLFVESVI